MKKKNQAPSRDNLLAHILALEPEYIQVGTADTKGNTNNLATKELVYNTIEKIDGVWRLRKHPQVTIIDAVDETKLRNHRFRVSHTCAPEELLNKIKESAFDYLGTRAGQAYYKKIRRLFDFDSVPNIPEKILKKHGIESIVPEKAHTKFTVTLNTLFGAPAPKK